MQPRQPAAVVAAIEQACRQPDAVGAAVLQTLPNVQRCRRIEAMRQRQHQKLAFGKFQEVVERQMALALLDRVMSSPRLPRVSNWHSRP